MQLSGDPFGKYKTYFKDINIHKILQDTGLFELEHIIRHKDPEEVRENQQKLIGFLRENPNHSAQMKKNPNFENDLLEVLKKQFEPTETYYYLLKDNSSEKGWHFLIFIRENMMAWMMEKQPEENLNCGSYILANPKMFEEVLEGSSPEVQSQLLFHLDIFIK